MATFSASIKDIRGGNFLPAYLLNGTETLLKEEWLRLLALYYLGENNSPEDICRIADSKTELKEIVARMNTPALFGSDRKIFIINDPPYLPAAPKGRGKKKDAVAGKKEEAEEKKKKKAEEEKIKKVFKDFWKNERSSERSNNVPQNIIIFRTLDTDKRRWFYGMLNKKDPDIKHDAVVEFSTLQGDDLKKWVLNRLKRYGKKIDAKAYEKLLLFTESDLWRIDREIAKINDYMDENEDNINTDTIEKLVFSSPQGNIFNLVDALGEGNYKKAFAYLKSLFFHKEFPLIILAMITRQYRLILKAASLKKEGIPHSKAAPLLEVAPFLVSKLFRQADNYKESELYEIIRLLNETDLTIKTGNKITDPEVALELLLARIAAVVSR